MYIIHNTQDELPEGMQRPFADLADTWTTQRRYNEFASLETRLKLFYPGLSVHLPQKRAFGRFDEEHIEQRRRSLATYLSELLANPITHSDPRCTELLYWFLHPDDNGEFKKLTKRSAWNKMAPSLGLNIGSKIASTIDSQKDVDVRSFLDHFIVTAIDIEEDMAFQLAEQSASAAKEKETAAVAPSSVETTAWSVDSVQDDRVYASAVGVSVLGLETPLDSFTDSALHLAGVAIKGLTPSWPARIALVAVAMIRMLLRATIDDYYYTLVESSLTFTSAEITDLLIYGRNLMFFPEPEVDITEAEECATETRAREIVLALIPDIVRQTF